jgi:hypothetical protein
VEVRSFRKVKKEKKKREDKKGFVEKLKQLLPLKEGCDRRHIFGSTLLCEKHILQTRRRETRATVNGE